MRRWDETGEVKIYAMHEYDEKNWSKRRYLPRLRWTERSLENFEGSKVLSQMILKVCEDQSSEKMARRLRIFEV